jgi:hypothetical protein
MEKTSCFLWFSVIFRGRLYFFHHPDGVRSPITDNPFPIFGDPARPRGTGSAV